MAGQRSRYGERSSKTVRAGGRIKLDVKGDSEETPPGVNHAGAERCSAACKISVNCPFSFLHSHCTPTPRFHCWLRRSSSALTIAPSLPRLSLFTFFFFFALWFRRRHRHRRFPIPGTTPFASPPPLPLRRRLLVIPSVEPLHSPSPPFFLHVRHLEVGPIQLEGQAGHGRFLVPPSFRGWGVDAECCVLRALLY